MPPHDLSRLGDWADLPFFREAWPGLEARLASETRTVLPPAQLRFAALEATQPDATRVVILGQDPYPTPGHANGLAFSVAPGVAPPRSLANVFRELEADTGLVRTSGDLSDWAAQGVLLLNASLSVAEGIAGAHAGFGWDRLVSEVLARLSDRPRAFLLWGNHARAQKPRIGGSGHLFVESAHPSPLSARRGFFGSRPFARVNDWLAARGETPIRWV